MAESKEAEKPDLRKGIPAAELPDGAMRLGVVDGEDVIVVRRGDEYFAIGASCTHYHGPLAEGLVVEDSVRCPWHHACFSLRSGEALRAPALDPVACFRVERTGDSVFVREKLEPAKPKPRAAGATAPATIVIVGGGAAGLAAADRLRRAGWDGRLTLLSSDD